MPSTNWMPPSADSMLFLLIGIPTGFSMPMTGAYEPVALNISVVTFELGFKNA